MTLEQAFRKIFLDAGYDIERVMNCDYLYEIEIDGGYKILTEEQVIEFAEAL